MSNLDQTLAQLQAVLSTERESRANGLEAITASKARRATMKAYLQAIDAELKPVLQAVNSLPDLPPDEQMQWAQAITAMRRIDAVRFLEVDTTGLTDEDEIIRVTAVNLSGNLFDDILIKPSRPITPAASAANGLTDGDLADAPPITEVWRRIQACLVGQYVMSYSQKFDIDKLNQAAARHQLPLITIIGDDLQRRCTQYYHGEYSLTLEKVCERIGHPLASKSALDRARGQYYILRAMAEGVSDVRPPRPVIATNARTSNETPDDGLGDLELDDHPF